MLKQIVVQIAPYKRDLVQFGSADILSQSQLEKPYENYSTEQKAIHDAFVSMHEGFVAEQEN